MKIFKILFYTLLLMSSTASFAQYYNNNNGMSRNAGVNRDIARTYGNSNKPPTPEEIEKFRNKRIDELVTKLKTAVNLDELQVIAIKNEYMNNSKDIDLVMKKEEGSEAEKAEAVRSITEKMDVNIKSYLNKDQKEKYALFIAEMGEKKNDKKDRKDKKGKKVEEGDLEKPLEEPIKQ